jgi:glycosyltransferase involved in cell wall biosynthesis
VIVDTSHEPQTGRIAQLISSDGPGGAERVVADVATALQSSGVETVVFLPVNGEGWLASQLEGSGVSIEYYSIERPWSPPSARRLAEAFRRHRIAVAHSHEFAMGVYGAWASWLVGIPHVVTMHGGRYYAERVRRRLALRAAAALSAQMVAVSMTCARDISRGLGIRRSRIRMIPNGVRFTPPQRVTLREELDLGPDDRLVVAVGNLYPVKGHVNLIDAFGLIASRHPNLHIAISGRGALADSLMARARAYELQHRVHLLGLRSDVSAVLAASDIFALPSLSEGMPLALLEAMFARCPIVASDVGDVSVALENGHDGLLVPPGDPLSLAEAIDRLLTNPAEAHSLGERAARRAHAEYDLSRMVDRYVGVYESALAHCH